LISFREEIFAFDQLLHLLDFLSTFSQLLGLNSKIGDDSAVAPYLLSWMHYLRFLDCHQPRRGREYSARFVPFWQLLSILAV